MTTFTATAPALTQPKRWDSSFSEELPAGSRQPPMNNGAVDRLLGVEPFSKMDAAAFPRHLPLRGILEHDTRLRSYAHGDIIVRQGDYGNSAFLILRGKVRVMLEELDQRISGRRTERPRSWLRDLLQPLTNARSPEVRDTRLYQEGGEGESKRVRWSWNQGVTNVLRLMPDAMERAQGVMHEGELFGEMAALGRMPRAATLLAEGEVELLEIRWQGLRDLRKYDSALREYIDARYRRFGLASTLSESPLLQNLDDDAIAKIAQAAEFDTYGSYDWYGSYQQLRKKDADPLSKEPIIAEQGHYTNGLMLIRSGFARLSRKYGHGEHTFSYLGKGGVYGLAELVHNAKSPNDVVPLQSTLRAVGFVDVVRIPTRIFEELILPHIPPEQMPPPISDRAQAKTPEVYDGSERMPDSPIEQGMMEFLVENRFINGTATMMINVDRCTRCDDCVRACASGHNNNPVFVRHGPIHDRYMVANACMHCADPVCMIGCPTGAIHRDQQSGDVVINDLTCIGCQTCAASCPYQNIRMVEIRDKHQGDALVIDDDGKPILKATKCDLCIDHVGGPACQRACPHDALMRVDMREPEDLARWLKR